MSRGRAPRRAPAPARRHGLADREHHLHLDAGVRRARDPVPAREPRDDLQPEAAEPALAVRLRHPLALVADEDDDLPSLVLDDDLDVAAPRPVRVAHDVRHRLADAQPDVVGDALARAEPGDRVADGVPRLADAGGHRGKPELEAGRAHTSGLPSAETAKRTTSIRGTPRRGVRLARVGIPRDAFLLLLAAPERLIGRPFVLAGGALFFDSSVGGIVVGAASDSATSSCVAGGVLVRLARPLVARRPRAGERPRRPPSRARSGSGSTARCIPARGVWLIRARASSSSGRAAGSAAAAPGGRSGRPPAARSGRRPRPASSRASRARSRCSARTRRRRPRRRSTCRGRRRGPGASRPRPGRSR